MRETLGGIETCIMNISLRSFPHPAVLLVTKLFFFSFFPSTRLAIAIYFSTSLSRILVMHPISTFLLLGYVLLCTCEFPIFAHYSFLALTEPTSVALTR
jgi:hypothetical protein